MGKLLSSARALANCVRLIIKIIVIIVVVFISTRLQVSGIINKINIAINVIYGKYTLLKTVYKFSTFKIEY